MPTFVIVHGAWSGAHAWRWIRPLLRDDGHDVFTPSLIGLGERRPLAPSTGGDHGGLEDGFQCGTVSAGGSLARNGGRQIGDRAAGGIRLNRRRGGRQRDVRGFLITAASSEGEDEAGSDEHALHEGGSRYAGEQEDRSCRCVLPQGGRVNPVLLGLNREALTPLPAALG